MKSRFAPFLLLALGLGGCAASGTSSGGGPTPRATPSDALPAGEDPRQDEHTRAADRALRDAREFDEGGDTAQAEQLYRQALGDAEAGIAADSTNPLAWRLAGEAAVGAGEHGAADRFLTRAEELRPIYEFETTGIREQEWIDLYQSAMPLVNSGRYEEATEMLRGADAIYDQRPEVMIVLGQLYAQLRRHDEAIDAVDRALRTLNDSAIVASMDAETVASWREQAEPLPIVRAQVLADAGRTEEAIEAFRGLIEDNPDNVAYRRNLATLLIQAGREEDAFPVYEELLAMPGLEASDLYGIGVGYYQGAAYDRAADAFRRAAEASPRDRDAVEMWARSLQIDSVYSELPPVAERWIELDPYNRNAYLILAQAENQLGNGARAGELVGQIEALEVTVNDLQLRRLPGGGGEVTGSLGNQTLSPGTQVTIVFTFYDAAGQALGTVNHTLRTPEQGMSEVFQVAFESQETVGGYSYEIRGL